MPTICHLGKKAVLGFPSKSKAQISFWVGVSLSQARNKIPLSVSSMEKAQLGSAELNNPQHLLASPPICLLFPNLLPLEAQLPFPWPSHFSRKVSPFVKMLRKPLVANCHFGSSHLFYERLCMHRKPFSCLSVFCW